MRSDLTRDFRSIRALLSFLLQKEDLNPSLSSSVCGGRDNNGNLSRFRCARLTFRDALDIPRPELRADGQSRVPSGLAGCRSRLRAANHSFAESMRLLFEGRLRYNLRLK